MYGRGDLSSTVVVYLKMYEMYVSELKICKSKMQAYENVSQHFRVSTKTVMTAVGQMKKDI